MANQWGADVPVSMPQPLPSGIASIVPMDGFTMTEFGLFHDLTAADHERLATPTYAPQDPLQRIDETLPDPTEEDPWPTNGKA